MAEMKCDLCGGRIVVGQGGIARCQNCDMEYSQDRVQEKLHESTSTNQNATNSNVSNRVTCDKSVQMRLMARNLEARKNDMRAELQSAATRLLIVWLSYYTVAFLLFSVGLFAGIGPSFVWFLLVLIMLTLIIVVLAHFYKSKVKNCWEFQEKASKKNPSRGLFFKSSANRTFSKKMIVLNEDCINMNKGNYYIRCPHCQNILPITNDLTTISCSYCHKTIIF